MGGPIAISQYFDDFCGHIRYHFWRYFTITQGSPLVVLTGYFGGKNEGRFSAQVFVVSDHLLFGWWKITCFRGILHVFRLYFCDILHSIWPIIAGVSRIQRVRQQYANKVVEIMTNRYGPPNQIAQKYPNKPPEKYFFRKSGVFLVEKFSTLLDNSTFSGCILNKVQKFHKI